MKNDRVPVPVKYDIYDILEKLKNIDAKIDKIINQKKDRD